MAKVTGSNPVEPTPFDASRLSLGPSTFRRGCGIIRGSAATRCGERLSMRAESGMPMKRPNWEALGLLGVIAVGAGSAGPGCALFPNPHDYPSPGRLVG